MDLLHKLAGALQQAYEDLPSTSEVGKSYAAILQGVRDLDSVLYNPDKCKAAGCADGQHKCDQEKPFRVVATLAAMAAEPNARQWAADCSPLDFKELIAPFMYEAIKRALGELNLSEDREIIDAKLAELVSKLDKFIAIAPSQISPNLWHDLKWMYDVAVRGLQLYAVELSRGWCHVHDKQSILCAECANSQSLQTLRYFAEAVKKVCSVETIQRLIGETHQESAFVALLKMDAASAEGREPHIGVGL